MTLRLPLIECICDFKLEVHHLLKVVRNGTLAYCVPHYQNFFARKFKLPFQLHKHGCWSVNLSLLFSCLTHEIRNSSLQILYLRLIGLCLFAKL